MKLQHSAPLLAVLTLILATGCATTPPLELTSAVGPAQGAATTRNAGMLVVHTAWDSFASGDPERNYCEDYTLYWPDNGRVQRVQNHLGVLDEGPLALRLPAGTYRIKARAARYGVVLLSAVIEPGKTTVVRLDDRAPAAPDVASAAQVSLPNGDVVGWKAVQ